jgi:hypothetical protein
MRTPQEWLDRMCSGEEHLDDEGIIRAIQSDARAAAIEEAAVLCATIADNSVPPNTDDRWHLGYAGGCLDCADYIRALAGAESNKGGGA